MKLIFLSLLFLAIGLYAGRYIQKQKFTPKSYNLRSYQIELDNDSVYVFDKDKKIGATSWDSSPLDSVFLRDNY